MVPLHSVPPVFPIDVFALRHFEFSSTRCFNWAKKKICTIQVHTKHKAGRAFFILQAACLLLQAEDGISGGG